MLLTKDEVKQGILPSDPRARHLLKTLHANIGTRLHVGILGERRGMGTILTTEPRLTFGIQWEPEPQAVLPLDVLVGLPRPQSARKVLHDLASLGARRITFFKPAKGDPAYATSTLWSSNEWKELLEKGAEQACSVLIPRVDHAHSLEAALANCTPGGWRIALDPYETEGPQEATFAKTSHAVLAIGPERGWDKSERDLLRPAGFLFRHLGDRILRVETACVMGSGLLLAGLRAWRAHRPLV